MSNPLSVRRVKVQTINENGEPDGKPSFGVVASDDHATAFNDSYETLEALNEAINKSPSILSVVDESGEVFGSDVLHDLVGKENGYHKYWSEGQRDGIEI